MTAWTVPAAPTCPACDVLIVGDILRSRVARSAFGCCASARRSRRYVAPPTLLPLNTASWVGRAGLNLHDFDEAITTNPRRRHATASKRNA